MSQAGSTSSGSGPSPGNGALVLIQTQTASDATSLPFTTGITGTYNNYLLVATSIIDPTFAGINFGLQISSDGGATYIATGYSSGTPSSLNVLPLIALESGATNPNVCSLLAALLNFTSGVGFVVSTNISALFSNDISPRIGPSSGGGGYLTPNFIVNAFQIVADDGTPFSGTFTLYGLAM